LIPGSKKRKYSDRDDGSDLNHTNNESSNTSLNASTFSSPWEARRMRVDMIEAKSRVTQLRREIENQNTIQANLEIKYSHKVSALEKEVAQSNKKVTDLDKHVKVLRKRENAVKEELVKVKKNILIQ
jgi:predicted  nucleic acid-binding Zn-ribbon protein